MSEQALDRVARALDLIPYILKHQGVSIKDLAKVFNTTSKEIARELSLLHLCGLPGYSHLELLDLSYDDPESVEVLEPQVLDRPRKLSKSETIAILLGLDQLALLSKDESVRQEILDLRARISQSLSSTFDGVTVAQSPNMQSEFITEILAAIAQRRAIHFGYISGGVNQPSEREVAPLALEQTREHSYLEAIDLGLGERRTFRLDRIVNLVAGQELTDELLASHNSTGRTNEGVRSSQSPQVKVSPLIKVSPIKAGKLFVEDNRRIVESNEISGDSCLIQLTSVNSDWILRTLIGLDATVEVLAPADLNREVQVVAQTILNGYDSTT